MIFRPILFLLSHMMVTNVAAQADCPSTDIKDIKKDPIVIAGMNKAWQDSMNSMSGGNRPSEYGFRIYHRRRLITVNGQPEFEHTTVLDKTIINVPGETVHATKRNDPEYNQVAIFHTHPEDYSKVPVVVNGQQAYLETVETTPSDADEVISINNKVPLIIRYEVGLNSGSGAVNDFEWGVLDTSEFRWHCECAAPTFKTIGNADPSCPDDNVPPPRPASTGDPHLFTPDGLAYDFHGAGEFVLLRSTNEGFEVQARQQRSGGRNSQIAVNTGFGFNVDNVEVSFVRSPESRFAELFIDGDIQNFPTDFSLDSGGRVIADQRTLDIRWSDGSRAVVTDYLVWMSLSLAISERHAGKVSGLLGNYDGNAMNDIVTKSGTDLSTRPDARDLYGIFAEGWRVKDTNTSLFHYYAGQDIDTFTDRLFPGRVFTVNDLTEEQRQQATDTCEAKGVNISPHLENCILDVGLTGNEEFADDAFAAQEQSRMDLEVSEIQGEIGIPSRECVSPATVDAQGFVIPELEGVYVGTTSNPGLGPGVEWETEFEVNQCGSDLYGLWKSMLEEAFAERRFEGQWEDGEFTVNLSYPYSFDFVPVTGASVACENMKITFRSDSTTLSGSWSASNCPLGGEVNLTRQ